MSDAQIYVGSTVVHSSMGVPIGFNHTFLFYDGDGNLDTTDDQEVIQGLPEVTGGSGDLIINRASADLTDDMDLDSNNDGHADVDPSTLNLNNVTSYFGDGESGWGQLVVYISTLGEVESGAL